MLQERVVSLQLQVSSFKVGSSLIQFIVLQYSALLLLSPAAEHILCRLHSISEVSLPVAVSIPEVCKAFSTNLKMRFQMQMQIL